jgi:hypothetical protein
VVKDSRYSNPRGETQPVIYTTFLQTGTGRGQMVLHVRVAGDPRSGGAALREEILRVDSTLPTFDVHTLDQEMGAALIQEHPDRDALEPLWRAGAAIGERGTLWFAGVRGGPADERNGHSNGVGARRIDVVWMVIREALVLVTIGVLIGVPAALAGARFASSQISGLLYGISATDPVTIALAGVFVDRGGRGRQLLSRETSFTCGPDGGTAERVRNPQPIKKLHAVLLVFTRCAPTMPSLA